jgi:hypothetical protein
MGDWYRAASLKPAIDLLGGDLALTRVLQHKRFRSRSPSGREPLTNGASFGSISRLWPDAISQNSRYTVCMSTAGLGHCCRRLAASKSDGGICVLVEWGGRCIIYAAPES